MDDKTMQVIGGRPDIAAMRNVYIHVQQTVMSSTEPPR